jgi:hypothetical protein
MCDADVADDAKLYIHDISDLRHPNEVSETNFENIHGRWLVERNGLVFYDGSDLAIINVQDAAHPKLISHVDTGGAQGFKVSDNGKIIALKHAMDSYDFIDVSNPLAPKPFSLDQSASANLINTPGKWNAYEEGHIPDA